MNDETFLNKLHDKKVKIDYKGNHKFRIVTHLGISKKNIQWFIQFYNWILHVKKASPDLRRLLVGQNDGVRVGADGIISR